MSDFTYQRTIVVCAEPATVYAFFSESERFASWWGTASQVDARPGGAVRIVYPNGIIASGVFEEVDPEGRVVFSYGYEGDIGPIPAGASRVEVTWVREGDGTRVTLVHHVADEAMRDAHGPGWRYQLSLFAGMVANAQHGDLDELMDRFFAAQQVESEDERASALASFVTEDFTFRDGIACLTGAAELAAHLQVARQHGVAMVIERAGPVRHCQGTVVCDWLVRKEGEVFLEGTNVVTMTAAGKISDVCGLWEMPSA